ncbi:MAG: ABC transporter ATP-binding protein [Acidisphaera sp.]|nr:ABC transporter ATP-binding protein [Acidisphaera sp.]
MSFLTVEDLVVRHGSLDVLQSLSLAVERGSFVALLGSSGCGKTTLLRAISGFNPVASGRITLAGRDITTTPPEQRGTAMVFQSYALWPHMTVAQNIGYGLRLRRASRARIAARVEEMLAMLHLPGLGARNVTQLSGGQRQRVALGRALAIDPEMLLLDEPLSNLDAAIRIELRHEIRAVQQRLGITALHVTHDREEAMVIADRLVVLRDGRIAQQGTPQEVYHRPASPFVASFMGADNMVRVTARAVPEGLAVQTAEEVPPSLLTLGEGGAHLAGPVRDGAFDAYFRASAARLLAADEPPAPASLVLPGRVLQASYPGDVWRYTIEAGGRRYLIDDPVVLGPGAATRVAIPAAALHLFAASAAA